MCAAHRVAAKVLLLLLHPAHKAEFPLRRYKVIGGGGGGGNLSPPPKRPLTIVANGDNLGQGAQAMGATSHAQTQRAFACWASIANCPLCDSVSSPGSMRSEMVLPTVRSLGRIASQARDGAQLSFEASAVAFSAAKGRRLPLSLSASR